MKILIKNAVGGYDSVSDIVSINRYLHYFNHGKIPRWSVIAMFPNNRLTVLFVGEANGTSEDLDHWFQWFKNAFSIASTKSETTFLEYEHENTEVDQIELRTFIKMESGLGQFVSGTRYNEQPYDRHPISNRIQPDYGMN